jgi:hypothetical protein
LNKPQKSASFSLELTALGCWHSPTIAKIWGAFWGPFEIGRSLRRGKANFMALTDTAIRLAKAESNDRKLADSKGLYLLVTVSGSKLWRLKYRIDGKEKKLALGSYPEVGLKQARTRRAIRSKLPFDER